MAERDLGGPASQRTGPQGTHNAPDNNGPAGRGFTRARGRGLGSNQNASKFPRSERVEFPAFGEWQGKSRGDLPGLAGLVLIAGVRTPEWEVPNFLRGRVLVESLRYGPTSKKDFRAQQLSR